MALDFPPTPVVGQEYDKYIWDGTGWVIKNSAGPDIYVELVGDTMSGDLHISKVSPALVLDKTAAGEAAILRGTLGSLNRWDVILGDIDVNSNFVINRYDDAGVYLNSPLTIDRATGNFGFQGNISLNHYQPVVRFDALGSDTTNIDFASSGVGVWQVAVTGNTFNIYGKDPIGTLSAFMTVDKPTLNISLHGNLYTRFLNIGMAAAGPLQVFAVGPTTVGTISTDGVSTVYNTTSDGRLKTDLKPFEAGEIIDKLQVYDFAWKDSGERCHGVIAQEAIEVYEWAVTHTPNDWWGVDYSKFVPLLLQEVKALRERVRQLESKT